VLQVVPSEPGTRLGEAARFLARTAHRRQVVFWISDFDAALELRDWRVLARRHDLTAIILRDPRDEVLPAVGWIELEDLESGVRELVPTGSRRLRERYQRDSRDRQVAARRVLTQARCEWFELRTDRSYLPVLMRYFAQRRQGRHR
jgi:hypothetical protein